MEYILDQRDLDVEDVKMKKKKKIKPRVIDMIKFLIKGNRRFKTIKDYDRKKNKTITEND